MMAGGGAGRGAVIKTIILLLLLFILYNSTTTIILYYVFFYKIINIYFIDFKKIKVMTFDFELAFYFAKDLNFKELSSMLNSNSLIPLPDVLTILNKIPIEVDPIKYKDILTFLIRKINEGNKR